MAMCAQSVLAAATVAAQGHVDVLMPTGPTRAKQCPICNFFLTISQSGERKTGVSVAAKRPIELHEKDLRIRHRDDAEMYKVSLRLRHLRRKQKNQSLDECEVRELEREPLPPLHPGLLYHAPTLEGFVKLNENGQPSTAFWNDDAGSLLGGNSLSKEQKTRAAAMFNSIWQGEPIEHIRAKEDHSIKLYGRRVTLSLSIQIKLGEKFLGELRVG